MIRRVVQKLNSVICNISEYHNEYTRFKVQHFQIHRLVDEAAMIIRNVIFDNWSLRLISLRRRTIGLLKADTPK